MRPLSLRLQAFGSYADEFAIDFARLGHHGVFSITGPTGAGKSTIFDAIVYALYDDLPGFRVNSHIRSQFACRGTRTEVTLEFEAEGRHWVLTRSPAQTRPSGRSASGVVEDPSTVALCEAGAHARALTRKRDVAERIADLVGLDKAQFEQVVLIPQGKFEEVLKARTQERAELLTRLFPVDVYLRTTEALRQLAAERGDAYEALTRGRAATEDRIRDEIGHFRAAAKDVVRTATSPDGPEVHDLFGTGVDDEVDLARLPELRTGMVDVLATVVAERDRADQACTAARDRLAEVRSSVERWRAWRSDVAEAADHAAQEAADAELARDIDRAVTVATLSGALGTWRGATDQLAALDVERRHLLAAVDAAWVGGYGRDALEGPTSAHRLASRLSAEAADLERADEVFVALGRSRRELEAGERELSGDTATLASMTEELDRTKAVVTAVEGVLADDAARIATRPTVEARVDRLAAEVAAVEARVEARRHLVGLEARLESAARRSAAGQERAVALRAAWRSGLAGRLATLLVDGQPCPTCGAADHPDPAHPAADAPGDDELEDAEQAARRLGEECHELEVRVAAARGALDSLPEATDGAAAAERLAVARRELAAIDAAADAGLARAAELEQLTATVSTLAADIEGRRSRLDGRAGGLAERRRRWEADRDAFVAEHGDLVSTADAARARRRLADAVTTLAANLESTAAATATRLQQLGVLADTMAGFGVDDPARLEHWSRPADELEGARTALAERAERRRDVAARIAAYASDGGPEVEPDVTPALLDERGAAEAHSALVGCLATLEGRLASIDAAAAELAVGSEAIASALAAKEEADTVAGLCAGLGSGPDATRLSLKNWVLAYYLRQVLAHANQRLHTMTNGRYALDLSGEHADGRRPWGLDISVLDAETGQSRPATTLSGGETFMAALALALGLADVVSAGSNYSIGALFVDEGFGSLDGDSLDTVIDVLRSLQDGGRMVGVISHVQDLKDALPNGIAIAPTTRGSVATIHYPDA